MDIKLCLTSHADRPVCLLIAPVNCRNKRLYTWLRTGKYGSDKRSTIVTVWSQKWSLRKKKMMPDDSVNLLEIQTTTHKQVIYYLQIRQLTAGSFIYIARSICICLLTGFFNLTTHYMLISIIRINIARISFWTTGISIFRSCSRKMRLYIFLVFCLSELNGQKYLNRKHSKVFAGPTVQKCRWHS